MSKKKTKTELFYEALHEAFDRSGIAKDYKERGIKSFEERFDAAQDFLRTQTITKRPPIKPKFGEVVSELAKYFVFEISKTDEILIYDTSREFRNALLEELTYIFTVKGVRGRIVSDLPGHLDDWYEEFGYPGGLSEFYLSRHPGRKVAHKLMSFKRNIKEMGLDEDSEDELIREVIGRMDFELNPLEPKDYGYLKNRRGMTLKNFNGSVLNNVSIDIDYERIKRIERKGGGNVEINKEAEQLSLF